MTHSRNAHLLLKTRSACGPGLYDSTKSVARLDAYETENLSRWLTAKALRSNFDPADCALAILEKISSLTDIGGKLFSSTKGEHTVAKALRIEAETHPPEWACLSE